jgi:hypothetical protein
MSSTVKALEPPVYDPPMAESGQQHSQAWTEYHQSVSDQLKTLQATVNRGVTDGSDAAAGDIGEYLTASASTPVFSGANTNVVSLSLRACDWDVSGHVQFVASGGTLSAFGCGVGGIDVLINATIPPGSTQQQLATAPRRYNVTAATTVWVVAVGFFSGGVTASGAIRARRMR